MSQNRSAATAAPRIPELDGLRGIAIMLVITFHYINNQLVHSQHVVGRWLAQLTSFGWVGVDLFFVLSGFFIGSILLKTRESGKYFTTFFVRRIVRILPNYYLLLIIFILIGTIPYFSSNHFLTGNQAIPSWSYFLMLHNNYMGYNSNLGNESISVTWSIGIEEQFYIIFPFVVYFVRRKWLPHVLMAVIAIVPLLRSQFSTWIPPYVLLPCRMDSIAAGALIAYYNHEYDLPAIVRKKIKWILSAMGMVSLLCAYLFIRYQDLGPAKNTLFATLFAGCLVLALTYKNNVIASLLRNKVLVWIGTLSYSLYLFHYLILGICQYAICGNDGLVIQNAADILTTVVAFGLSLGFAWLVYKKLEQPMVLWGKRFKY